MNIHFLRSFILLALLSLHSQAQTTYKPGEIRQKLEKLNVLVSVLYVAAHPDDENTRLIAYFANESLTRTAYLSATRGDGGQNLIGPEIREGLGLIRTHELLGARAIDGGEQFFSRANDFGYSKHPDETFNIWDKEKVLADFVWVFRKFRPDVIVTRFSLKPGVTHGHHTASAMLAKEAFALSADENAYPEQLAYVDPWQPKKIFWNTSWWFFRNTGQKMDTASLVTVNVGKYNPLMGASYPEVAARSRSMHKSQGFGSSGRRGDQFEYLDQWGGELTGDVFGGIETSWNRVAGSEEVAFFINKGIEMYDEQNPATIIDPLMSARRALDKLEDSFWKKIKIKEIEDIILAVSGLYIAVTSDQPSYAVGDTVELSVEAINRADSPFTLDQVKISGQQNAIPLSAPLLNNKVFNSSMKLKLSDSESYAHPYWLIEEGTLGMYEVNDQMKIGKPQNTPALEAEVVLSMSGEKIIRKIPVVFKRTDPVDGEVTEPLTIGPPAMVNIEGGVLVFGDENAKTVNVRVIAGKENVSGEVSLDVPKGWEIAPKNHSFNLSLKGEEQLFSFEIIPPGGASEGFLRGKLDIGGKTFNKGLTVIDYDHIPKQTLYPDARVRIVKLDIKKKGNLIGYIEGAGDAIPENLEQVGYTVEMLSKDDVVLDNLEKYDAIILGVRAFNTVDWLSFKNEVLFEYVKTGGNLMVQYNTNRRLVTNKVAPYPLRISRDRVAVEEAPVSILNKAHPAMNEPNKISQADFEGWVQERGLYFPDEWSDSFTPILASNDPGESSKEGGLLIAKYGEGYYVYSGYSWFRELPAGVPGAYRIFVNLISLGK